MNKKKLTLQHETVLVPKNPFNFSGTFYKPSHFPAPIDLFENDSYWVTMRFKNKNYGINLKPIDTKRSLINMRVFSAKYVEQKDLDAITTEIRFRFGMELDLSLFIKIAESDPILAPVEARWRGMRPSCAFSLYELLCISIVLQNAQISRSVKMLEAMLARFGKRIQFDGVCLYVFWPEAFLAKADEAKLRELKVGYRAKSLLSVSKFFSNHPNFENEVRLLAREEAAKRLREIYGVGPATAWYLLFESLKYVDAFDHVSPWEQKIFSRLLFNEELVPAKRILNEAGKRWGAWRMLACHYIFEDLFWRRQHEKIEWLDELIRI